MLSRSLGCGSVVLLAIALALAGCGRIPPEVLNSPPAKYRLNLEPPDSPSRQGPAPLQPRPQDKVASAKVEVELEATRDEKTPADELAQVAAQALGRIGAPSVPGLVAELQSPDAARRERAAQTLALVGPAAVDAAEPLVILLEDPDEEFPVKLACAAALKEMGPALWPRPPKQFVAPADLAPADLDPPTEVAGDQPASPEIDAIARRHEARRIEFDQRSEQREKEYYDQLGDYHRRVAIAERAVNALSKLALEL